MKNLQMVFGKKLLCAFALSSTMLISSTSLTHAAQTLLSGDLANGGTWEWIFETTDLGVDPATSPANGTISTGWELNTYDSNGALTGSDTGTTVTVFLTNDDSLFGDTISLTGAGSAGSLQTSLLTVSFGAAAFGGVDVWSQNDFVEAVDLLPGAIDQAISNELELNYRDGSTEDGLLVATNTDFVSAGPDIPAPGMALLGLFGLTGLALTKRK